MKKILFIFLIIVAGCNTKPSKDQYDALYKTKGDGYPEYLFLKKLNDSTYSYKFFPEDYEMSCEAQKKGLAVNKFLESGPVIEMQKDGSGQPTYRYVSDNYKCSLLITIGYKDMVKVHSHCNGGNNCPKDTEYVIEKD
jgi:hypothetical protein